LNVQNTQSLQSIIWTGTSTLIPITMIVLILFPSPNFDWCRAALSCRILLLNVINSNFQKSQGFATKFWYSERRIQRCLCAERPRVAGAYQTLFHLYVNNDGNFISYSETMWNSSSILTWGWPSKSVVSRWYFTRGCCLQTATFQQHPSISVSQIHSKSCTNIGSYGTVHSVFLFNS
jgi:hypothetical protein